MLYINKFSPAYVSLPWNHSSALTAGSHVTLVGGNRSSWKKAVLTRGTVKLIGSIVVFVNLQDNINMKKKI